MHSVHHIGVVRIFAVVGAVSFLGLASLKGIKSGEGTKPLPRKNEFFRLKMAYSTILFYAQCV